jgi:hypothetical protein
MGEPHNLARGWVGFDFEKAFDCPVKMINDAALQALGSYNGGRMLFLGLGTGLGSALITDGVVEPMELRSTPGCEFKYASAASTSSGQALWYLLRSASVRFAMRVPLSPNRADRAHLKQPSGSHRRRGYSNRASLWNLR